MSHGNFLTCHLFVLILGFWVVEGQFKNSSQTNQSLTAEETCNAKMYPISRENKFLSDYMVSLWKGKPFVTLESEKKIANPADRISDYTRYSAARLGLNELPNAKKLIPEFGPVYNDILSFRYRGSESIVCGNVKELSLFIAIFSGERYPGVDPYYANNREVIRDNLLLQFGSNWGGYNRFHIDASNPENNLTFQTVNYRFFVGNDFGDNKEHISHYEESHYRDIVEIDMLDTKENSSLKLAAVLNWVTKNCPKVSVVAVMNNGLDYSYPHYPTTFINVTRLGAFATSKEFTEDRVSGLPGNPYPFEANRNNGNSERLLTYEQFPWNNFPNYPKKSAFVIKGSMIIPLMAAMQTTPMLPMDDVYLGICQLKAGYDFYKCGTFLQHQNGCF